MRKLLLSVIASLSVFLCGMNVYAIKLLDLEVYNGDDYESPGTHRILDILTGEYVRVGSLVQVIWAGPNGEVDLINLTNFMPGGDDQVLLYDFGAFDGVKEAFARIGDGYVEDGEGRLITCFPAIDLNYYDAGGVADNIKVYVRVFNMEDPYENLLNSFELGPITWYDSPVTGLPEPDFFRFGYYNFLLIDGQQLGPQFTQDEIWKQYFIPEPSTLLLLFAAVAGLKFVRRKK